MKKTLIRTAIATVVLMGMSAGANASCWVPSLPIGATQYDYDRYHRELEDFNRCQQRAYEDQQRQMRNQQIQRENNNLFNNNFGWN